MFEIPTEEQWKQVFTVSEEIMKKAPWNTIPEELIIECSLDSQKEPFYITVHGLEEEVCGISVYEGKSDISKYLNILDARDDASFQEIIGNQSCVTMICGEEFHLSPGDVTAMRSGEYTPDGSPHSFIYFRKYSPGYTPWYADKNDLELLFTGLTYFLKIFDNIPQVETDHKVLILKTDNEDFSLVEPDESYKTAIPDIVKDDLYVARLKQLKKNAKVIEIDECYLPNPITGQLSEIPLFPKFCVIADVNDGFIADQCIFDESTEENEAFFLFISNYFKKNGLPRKIRIKKQNTGHFLHDLCKKLRIELEERNDLPIVDDFMTMINGITPGE